MEANEHCRSCFLSTLSIRPTLYCIVVGPQTGWMDDGLLCLSVCYVYDNRLQY